MNIYYDKDCDLSIIQGKKVTIVGYFITIRIVIYPLFRARK